VDLLQGRNAAGAARGKRVILSVRRCLCRAAGTALLAAAAGCAAAAPRDAVQRDSAGIAILENRAPAGSRREAWRLDTARAVALDVAPEGAIAVFPGGAFAAADERGGIAWYDRRGRTTRTAAILGSPAVTALFATAEGGLVAWDADRLAVVDVGTDGRPGTAREFEAALPRGSVDPLGALDDGSVLVSVRDAARFYPAPAPTRDTVPVFRLGPAGTHSRVFSIPGPEELTWGGPPPRGAMRLEAPFARGVFVTVAGDRVWVADALQAELRGYDAAGRLRTIVRAPVRGDSVHPDDAARWRERLRRLARGFMTAEEFQRRQASLAVPATWPPFAALLVAPRGELWVRAGSVPGSVSRWNVFDVAGTWLGEVRVPPQLQLVAVGDRYVIATEGRAQAEGRTELVPLVR
jgi:hypothetical protein